MVLLLLFLFLPLPHHPLLHFRLKACLSRSPRPRSPSQALALPEASSLSSLPLSPLQPSRSLSIFVCVPLLSLPPADISLQVADLASLSIEVSPSVEEVLPGQNPPTPPATAWHFGRGLPNARSTAYQVLSLPAHLLPSHLPVCLFHCSLCLPFSLISFTFCLLTLTLPFSPICTIFPAFSWEETPVVELPVLDVPCCRDPGLTLPSWV